MNKNSIVLIKWGDCIDTYERIYLKKSVQVFEGALAYVPKMVEFFRNKKDYDILIISFGSRNKKIKPLKNIELKVINISPYSQYKILRVLRFISTNFLLFVYLLRKNPTKILNMGGLRYLPITIIYSFLSNTEIYKFLAGWIEGHIFLNKLLVKMIEKRISKVISINKINIDILHNFGYSGEWDLYRHKCKVISKSQIKSTELSRDKKFRVLFLGRLAYVKGIDILQEVVLKAKKDISFYVIGDGPYYESLKSFKHENGLNNLHLLGYIPNREIYSFIKDSDVGFMPSKSEGIPGVVIEFMLMETPVVASNVGGIPEIITDGENGFLLNPNDVDGYLKKFEQIKNDKQLLLDLSKGTLKAKKEILNFNKDFLYHLEKIIE